MDDGTEALQAVALSLIAGAVIMIVVGVLVFAASRKPFPASIVMSLTVLAVLALIGYAISGESRAELAAIAGTAVGALAGGTTALLTSRNDENDPGSDAS